MQISQSAATSRPFRAPSSIFWAGFIIRVLYITIVHTYRIRPEEDHLQFGWEMGRIARALATGFGYSDPFTSHSGPTAWSPPLYPLLIAGVFKIFGVYTAASAWVLLVTNSIFSAATSSVIYEIAARCFHHTGRGRKIALRTRQKGRPLVKLALGSLSRRDAVRRPLDLGHVHHGVSLFYDPCHRLTDSWRRRGIS
jgi:hypothetical protein